MARDVKAVDPNPALRPDGALALLESTPSLTWCSDSGTGSNYSCFLLRGVNQRVIKITLDERFSAPAYSTFDLRGALGLFGTVHGEKSVAPRLRLYLNDVLEETDHYPSGSSYLLISRSGSGQDELTGILYYYPLAGRSLSVSLDFSL